MATDNPPNISGLSACDWTAVVLSRQGLIKTSICDWATLAVVTTCATRGRHYTLIRLGGFVWSLCHDHPLSPRRMKNLALQTCLLTMQQQTRAIPLYVMTETTNNIPSHSQFCMSIGKNLSVISTLRKLRKGILQIYFWNFPACIFHTNSVVKPTGNTGFLYLHHLFEDYN